MQKITLPHNHGQRIEQELQRVPSTEEFQTVAELFKQMGDGSRIRIFGFCATVRSVWSTFPRWWR